MTNTMKKQIIDEWGHIADHIDVWWFEEEKSWVCPLLTKDDDQLHFDAQYFKYKSYALYILTEIQKDGLPIHVYKKNGELEKVI
tara:strand:- start:273 stop:524 length:252 start_codon:yes stop_codon:yes gene_type:complete